MPPFFQLTNLSWRAQDVNLENGYFMEPKNKYNTIKVATCNDDHKSEAIEQLFERSLLFNRSDDVCGIVISKNNEKQFIPISAIPDNVNIEKRDGVVTLVEDPVVDSITTQADHEGIDWKSQKKVAETSAEKTVILLCTQDVEATTDIGVIGGEILEVGEGVYSHYQISLTSTGSRLLKGATTFGKKAKLVLAKYNGTYYYGIRFKSAVPANIYFAGWAHIPGGISAPSYTVYNDGDLSEIIELDDDSDIGTQVVDFEFLTYEDITWEFFTAPYVKTSAWSASQYYPTQSTLTRRTDFTGKDGISFGTGYAHNQNYYYLHFYDNVNYEYEGQTFTASHGIRLYSDRITMTSAGCAGYIRIPGNDTGTIGFYLKNNNTNNRQIRIFKVDTETRMMGEQVASYSVPGSTTQWVTFEDLPKGEYYFYQSGSFDYYSVLIGYNTVTETVRDATWNQEGNNKNYSLTNGLRITTDVPTLWYEDSVASNEGYIVVSDVADHTNPAMTLRVLNKCSVTVGFLPVVGSNSNIRISETLDTSDEKWNDSVSVNNSLTTTIAECTYNYNGTEQADLYIMNEVGPAVIMYVKVDYPQAVDNSDAIPDIIRNLPTTGEDGSPHIIRLNGEITREMLLKCAATLREDSNKQIILDCSEGYMETEYVDWRSDTETTQITYNGITYSLCLNSCFSNCVSLREFYYPHNVTSTGSDTFRNCSFLRKVRLNDEITTIGDNKSQWSANNNSLFAGARLKTIFIPKNVATFSGYTFSFSNIINVYFAEESAFINAYTQSYGNWASFPSVKEQLKFKCPPDLYAKWSQMNGTFNSYGNGGLGADGDGVQYIAATCKWSDHVELWEGTEDDINYTE